mmetsp:Transcript_18714/g.43105  ORF Transcript_18714/g.43105 Transcript_18714/m.43105 type:complete len:115 (+) Transcript_18714:4127-4471(+)
MLMIKEHGFESAINYQRVQSNVLRDMVSGWASVRVFCFDCDHRKQPRRKMENSSPEETECWSYLSLELESMFIAYLSKTVRLSWKKRPYYTDLKTLGGMQDLDNHHSFLELSSH